MKLADSRLWLSMLSAFGIGCLIAPHFGRTAPGDLATVHGRDADLNSRTGCASCHGGGGRTMAEACRECHADIGSQISREEGLHGSLERDVSRQCALCHSDHHGADFAIVNKRSFAIAGVADPGAFPHDLVGFAMAGPHLELSCAECHPSIHVPILAEGERRFIGQDQDCATCHADPHDGRIARACADCHAQEAFDRLTPFVHDERFPLIGGHADLSCAQCHAPDGEHTVEALGGVDPAPPWRACADCHESPHASGFVEGIAQLVQARPGESCASCHAAEHTDFARRDIEVTPEQHAASGFTLDLPHDEAACADCHAAQEDDFASRFPGRDPDACAACHDDPHGGQFDDVPFAAAGCLACHDRHRFEPHSFDVEDHALASLPLEGSHLEAECNACHLVSSSESPDGAAGAARVFHGTPSRCESCHDDAHRGFFGRTLANLPALPGGECSRCHEATSFSDVIGEFDHGFWTDFEVLGAHAQNACESCHGRSAVADDHGRTFGWSNDHFGRAEGCESCHADPHDGFFRRASAAAGDPGEGDGCAACHVETSFRTFPDGFDHGASTGFALQGAHGGISCAECHPPILGGAGERTFERARGSNCADCHGRPHAGQFQQDGETDCARCHTNTERFSRLAFDHDTDSRFPLDAAHAALSCSACHKPWALEDGARVVRYRPLGMECIDCHGTSAGGRPAGEDDGATKGGGG